MEMESIKKHKVLLLTTSLIILVVAVFIVIGLKQPDTNGSVTTPSNKVSKNDKIWVISDTHFISESLYDDGERFQFIKNTAAGKDLDYQNQRLEALVWQVEKERPAVLIVSGDLTLNGEKASIEELAQYFQRIEKYGTQVYVIPGNHDIADGWAKKYQGDKMVAIEQIMPQDFSEIFEEMGYQEAISRDKQSLSYAVQPFADVLILMIDTNKYIRTESTSSPKTGGVIRPETIKWLEEMLILGEEQGATIIPVTHHNLIDHNQYLNKGFTLDNAAEICELFAKYDVQLNLSGHIHAQDIASKEEAGKTMIDIATGSFAILSNSIGEITIEKNKLQYQRQTLKLNQWAKETKQTDPNLLNYSTYSDNLFRKDGEGMAYRQMFEENWYDKATAEKVAKFVGDVNVRFFDGQDFIGNGAELQKMKQDEGYLLLKEQPDSFLLNYVETIMVDRDIDDINFSLKGTK